MPSKPSDRSLGLKPFTGGDSEDQEDDLTDRFVNYVHNDDETEPLPPTIVTIKKTPRKNLEPIANKMKRNFQDRNHLL